MDHHRSIRSYLVTAAKIALMGLIALLLWTRFHSLDMAEVLTLLRRLGPLAVLPLLPYALVTMLDARGWRHTMPAPREIPMFPLGAIRLATDAVMNTFPAGVAFAETLRPVLLQRRFGLRWTDAVAVTIISKINIAITQMVFLIAGVTLAMINYAGPLRQTGLMTTPSAGIGTAAAAVIITGVLLLPYSGGRLTQLAGFLERIPFAAVQRMLQRGQKFFTEIDGYLHTFRSERRSQLIHSLAYFMLSWLAMTAETWLILTLLVPGVTIVQALILESIAALAKLLFFFIPSGLGIQEISFAALLSALIGPEALAVTAAFIILRRGKELVWAGIGLASFSYLGVNPFHFPIERSKPV